MDTFKYTKLAAESGKDGLIAIGIFAVIAAFVIYKFSNRPEGFFDKTGLIILGIIIVFGIVAVKNAFTKLHSAGEWTILIDNEQLQWNGPEGIDISFNVKLRDIKLFKITREDNNNYSQHELILDNGDEIVLSEESGLDFDDFSQALKDRGVAVEATEIDESE